MPASPIIRLGVNVDHVATVRNARGGRHPDPVRAAEIAIAAGADGITAHLREDRRHIVDDDIARLKAHINKPLNLEMAPTDEMVGIARECPSARRLHCAGTASGAHHRRRARCRRAARHLGRVVGHLRAAGIRVSLFIAPDPAQIEAAAELGAPVIEIHTGAWCEALAAGQRCGCAGGIRSHYTRSGAGKARGPRSPRRPRPRLCRQPSGSPHCPKSPNSTSAISLSARRSLTVWAIRCEKCARRWIAAEPKVPTGPAACDDPRHRFRHHRRAPHRQGDRAPRRPLHRPGLHRGRTRNAPNGDGTGSKPTPRGLPPRRRAPRRWEPACVRGFGGATWAWSTCRRAVRPCN